MEPTELPTMLKLFYAEARKVTRHSGKKTIQSQHCESQFVNSGLTEFFFWLPSKKAVFHYSIISSIQDGKRSSRSITERSSATGIDFFQKAQASNFSGGVFTIYKNHPVGNFRHKHKTIKCEVAGVGITIKYIHIC